LINSAAKRIASQRAPAKLAHLAHAPVQSNFTGASQAAKHAAAFGRKILAAHILRTFSV
jgi:hypothetical protein